MTTELIGTATQSEGTPRLSHREQEAYYAALRAGTHLLDSGTIVTKLGVRPDHAKRILHNLNRKGAVDRVARGQYAVVPPEVLFERHRRGVDPRPLLDELMQRTGLGALYYVAYQSAAQMYDATHQVPFVLQVALARQHRPLRFGATEVRFVRVDPDHFYGIEERRYQGVPLRVSDRERTALDLVDRPELGGGSAEVARTLRSLLDGADTAKLVHYAVRLGNHSAVQRLGYLLELLGLPVAPAALETLQGFRGRVVVPLEPGGALDGEVNRRWRVRVNVDLDDTTW